MTIRKTISVKEIADDVAVSIREVAVRAGVSRGTVSKVLNQSAGAQIAFDTRERVRRAAEELGYRPDPVARALARRRIDAVGVVLPPGEVSPLSSTFFATMFDALLRAAADHRQTTTVFPGRAWADSGEDVSAFVKGRCDGLIVFVQSEGPLPSDPAGGVAVRHSSLVASLAAARFPFVVVSDSGGNPLYPSVDVDNHAAAAEMTRHVLSLGHRRIAHLPGDPAVGCVAPRVAGYRAALEAAGVTPDPRLCAPCGFASFAVRRTVENLMALPAPERPTALFCCNDAMALEAMRSLARLGLRVPEDVSVAGFDDVPEAAAGEPPLTTVRQPYRELGREALSLLMEQIEDGRARGPARRELPTELVVRGSTAVPPLL
jgi:DNA-binding LacI/PurR family transcriptional regulator